MGRGVGWFIVAAWGGFLGGFVFLYATDFVLTEVACVAGEQDCVRQWVSALSGWAAAVAALATITVLLVQAKAARMGAVTARRALQVARESSERQLRAYVGCDDVVALGFKADETARAVIALRNMGQTPAYNVSIEVGWSLSIKGSTLARRDHEVKYADFGPGQPLPVRIDFDSSIIDQYWHLIEDKTAIFSLWFSVSYRDAFDHPRKTSMIYAFAPPVDDEPPRFMMLPGGGRFE